MCLIKVNLVLKTDRQTDLSVEATCRRLKKKGSSAPGIDGFQVNWLWKFWSSFNLVTFYAINECYRTGSLTSPLRRGIKRHLKKGQIDPTLTGNYRPISLLTIHYKLLSCCITQQLRPLVGRVIGQQQKAYVPGNVLVIV